MPNSTTDITDINNNTQSFQLLENSDYSIYLEDILPTERVWNKHKRNSDRVANFYRDSEEYNQYANRIDLCSQFLDFKLIAHEDQHQLKLNAARFCRVRYCPICQWRRSLKWKAKAFKILPAIVEEYSNYRWLFLTLTVQNCEIKELRLILQQLNKAWQRISQRKMFPGVGWLRSTEITKSENGLAHPHFHCLLMVKPSYFGKYYIKQVEWVNLWKSCLRVDYEPVVDIKAIKRDCQPTRLIPEILKYCVKESDLICDRQWFFELTNQMHNIRTVATGGIIKECLRKLEQDRILETTEVNNTQIKHLYFDWRSETEKYRLLQ